MPQAGEIVHNPDLTKCQGCIFFRIAFGVRCLRGSPGEKTIIEAANWIKEARIPEKPYPQCQNEINAL